MNCGEPGIEALGFGFLSFGSVHFDRSSGK